MSHLSLGPDPLLFTYDQEVVELTGVLDTSGATTDDNHVHQAVNLLLRLVLEGGSLDTVKKSGADLVGITELLEEAAVVGHTLDTERLVLTADSVDKVVVRDGDSSIGTTGVGVVWGLVTAGIILCQARSYARTDSPTKVRVLLTGSTFWPSASYTATLRCLWRVM